MNARNKVLVVVAIVVVTSGCGFIQEDGGDSCVAKLTLLERKGPTTTQISTPWMEPTIKTMHDAQQMPVNKRAVTEKKIETDADLRKELIGHRVIDEKNIVTDPVSSLFR